MTQISTSSLRRIHGARSGVFRSEVLGQVEVQSSGTARLLVLAVIVTVFEGAARKWLFPGSGLFVTAILYFSKDLCLLGAAVTALRSRVLLTSRLRESVVIAIVLILIGSVLSFSQTTPILGAILTIRSLIVFPMLAIAASKGLRSYRDIQSILMAVAFCTIGSAILGVAQFYLPASHVLNSAGDSTARAFLYAGRVRAFGPFSFISGMTAMATIGAWAAASLISVRRTRTIGVLCAVASVICGVASISRGGTLFPIAIIGASLVVTRIGRNALPIVAIVAIGAWIIGTADMSPSKSEVGLHIGRAILARHDSSDSVAERAMNMHSDILTAFRQVPLGEGIGLGQQAVYTDAVGKRVIRGYETELARIVFEIGVVGLFGVVFLRAAIMARLFITGLVITTNTKSACVQIRKAAFFSAGVLFATNTCFNHVACSFAWIIVAVALGSLNIDQDASNNRYQPR